MPNGIQGIYQDNLYYLRLLIFLPLITLRECPKHSVNCNTEELHLRTRKPNNELFIDSNDSYW